MDFGAMARPPETRHQMPMPVPVPLGSDSYHALGPNQVAVTAGVKLELSLSQGTGVPMPLGSCSCRPHARCQVAMRAGRQAPSG